MTIRTNKGISKQEFIQRTYKMSKEFQAIQNNYDNKLQRLAAKYLLTNCEFKIGNSLAIKDSPEGFTSFHIEKIVPHVDFEAKQVRLKAYGIMSGEGKEDAQKMIWLDEIKKSEPVKAQTL